LSPSRVPFIDLSRQDEEIHDELEDAFLVFLREGRFILGPEVASFEREFSSYCGAKEGVGVASGTDALVLTLKALGAGKGDEVITSALSAPPTAVAISLTGARPVFADIDPVNFNLDPGSVKRLINERTRFLVAVHLYGRMAAMPELVDIADRHHLVLIEDCAQAHGSSLQGKMAGTWGRAGCYSFYPTKNLGAYGDGGMVITADAQLAERLRMLRDYGRIDRDRLGEIGLNSRLDELQAAFLRVKMQRLDDWNRRRRVLSSRYLNELSDLPLRLPDRGEDECHCFHLFVVAHEKREELAAHLRANGVETAVHYPVPLHIQKPYAEEEPPREPCPVAETAAQQVLSLPLYPQLSDGEQDRVITAVREFFAR
jgi:dTDP-4-amino-4,6-dideoxygalactose transaminase